MSDVKTAPAPRPATSEPASSKKDRGISAPEAQNHASGQSVKRNNEQQDSSVEPTKPNEVRAPPRGRTPDSDRASANSSSYGSPSSFDTQLLNTALMLTTRNVENAVTSANLTLRAVEEVAQSAVELGQRNFDQLATLMRSLPEVRSMTDLATLQREHTRATVEDLLQETSRLGHELTRRFGEIMDSLVRQQLDVTGGVRRTAV